MSIQCEQIEMATPAGFEPAAFSLENCRVLRVGLILCAGPDVAEAWENSGLRPSSPPSFALPDSDVLRHSPRASATPG